MTWNDTDQPDRTEPMSRHIGRKAARRLAAQRRSKSPWFWLGMLGLIGWAVAVPTLLGVALGVWLDSLTETGVSWTLTMMALGLVVGIFNAWHWVTRESGQSDDASDLEGGGQ